MAETPDPARPAGGAAPPVGGAPPPADGARQPAADVPIRLVELGPLSRDNLAALGWEVLYDDDRGGAASPYLAADAVVRTEADVEALALAGDALYALFVEAADRVVTEGRLADLGIPQRAHRLIEHTWHDERHWHLYGRFDLAETDAGPKLIEFNADTPTCVPETSVLQWAQATAAAQAGTVPPGPGGEPRQFNGLFERLVEQFGRWKAMNDDLDPVLVCTYADAREDEVNAEVVAEAAREAGFEVFLRPLQAVTWDAETGVFVRDGDAYRRCDFVFKLVPWEFVIDDEPALYDLVERIVLDRLAVVANPVYALVFQSKRLLVELSRLFPDDPYLLPAALSPFELPPGRPYVEKVSFGREGANTAVYHADHSVVAQTSGAYAGDDGAGYGGTVYQAFADLPHDAEMRLYQAGVFWAFEACAVGYRRGGVILDGESPFVGHVVAP